VIYILKFIKNNKIFSILIFIGIFTFIIGILINSLLNKDTLSEISNNINSLISNYKSIDTYNLNLFRKTLFNNLFITLIIWLFGISIIGIFIILFIYIFKVFIMGLEFISLFSNLGFSKIIFIILYLIPQFICIFNIFILSFYAISFSLFLTKLIFKRGQFNIKYIRKRYINILIISLFISIFSSIIEVFLIPKIIYYCV
jgi:uncharacterized membrane protein SpoIIM required for sporulation